MLFRKYTCVRQSDQSDCGAAALATIALHHRRPLGVHQLRELAGTDRVGTNLLGLVGAAEKLGFSARGVKGLYEALPLAPLPAIVHTRTPEGMGHFVVLHQVTKAGVVVADPGRGVQKLSREQFCQRWTGHVLLVVPEGKPPAAAGPVAPWRRFLGLLGLHRPVLLEAALCALIMTVLGVATSYYVQHLVDSVLVRNETRLLNALGVGMVLVIAFRTLFGLLREYLLAHVSRKIDLALIAGYARHVLRMPMRFFEMRRVGEILSRVQDAAKVREAVGSTATTAVVDGSLVVLLSALLWIYDMQLALVASAFIPLLLGSVLVHHPAVKRLSREAMEASSQVSAHLIEDINGVETIKAQGAERFRSEMGESRLVELLHGVFALQKLGMSMNAVSLFITALASVVVLWYGGHRVMAGALTIGQLMFFYSLLGYLLSPLERLAGLNLKIQDALVAVDRLYQVLDLPTEPLGEANKARLEAIREGIWFRDISFHYGCRANVLEGLKLYIPAGRTVAVVGESGSGKSTLLKLLLGFHTPTAGSLLIDGVDIRDCELGSLRGRIGLVSQEPFVFNGTLYENVIVGQSDVTQADVARAIRAAGLEEFVNSLPERYETVLGERGVNMSGGQRQRLAIARALVRAPEVLVFDEATSHLDTATERAIQENLRTVLAGKTVLLIAHRLSTVKEADRICVLHQGRVVEQGTHRELLALGGRYAALWRAQTSGSRSQGSGVRSQGAGREGQRSATGPAGRATLTVTPCSLTPDP
jgi:ABC-type bacteriocin transporter